jgi:hypothetical protein
MDLNATARMLEANGQDVTLRRVTAPGFFIDVPCRARIVDFQPEELVGNVLQGDRRGILSNAEIALARWPGPPRRGDQILYGPNRTLTIQGCDTVLIGDVVVRHNLHLRGT